MYKLTDSVLDSNK